jgi:hypothetical protein
MDYCLGDGDGSAAIWSGEPVLDVDGDDELDAIGLDVDGDGRFDDAMADLDHDGLADHVMFDLDDDGHAEASFTDDGSGTWAVGMDASASSGALRWFGLDGVEHTSSGPIDFDADGKPDRLLDVDRDGLADRALRSGPDGGFDTGYVDTDGDGRWDLKFVDSDGDGASDDASPV